MQVDPEFLRKLDPRKSYSPTPLPPGTDEAGRGSRLHAHLPPPSSRAVLATPEYASTLDALTTDALRNELHRRTSSEARLRAQRERLIGEIAELDTEIAKLHGTG